MMLTTVVGSFPFNLNTPKTGKDKLLNFLGLYDPYKQAIKSSVISQLDSGIDIVSDGQVRGDMVSSFSKFIPGMKFEKNSNIIVSKIQRPSQEITVKDLKFAKSVINDYYNNNVPEDKGVKGIITGPSTIVYSSRIESFYKDKNQAILDLAHSLRFEVDAIVDKINPKYIQFDEPFLSTGMVDLKVAKEAIGILSDGVDVPVSMHVCGTLDDVFKQLITFNIDILDCEFAGNNINIKVLEDNVNLINNKKIGFGCIDTTLNEVDSYENTKDLIKKGIDLLGKDRIILDPDCGLRKTDIDIAFKKLKLISSLRDELE